MTEIDWARPEDIPSIVQGCRALLQTLPWAQAYKDFTPTACAIVQGVPYHPLRHMDWATFVAYQSDEREILTGFVIGSLSHHELYPGLTNIREVGLWVSPRYRQQGIAKTMMKRLAQWGFQHGAQGILTGGSRRITAHALHEHVTWRPLTRTHPWIRGMNNV